MKENKPVSIKYISAFSDHSGYGEASRQTIYALHKVGVNLTTEKISFVREIEDFGQPQIIAEKAELKPIDYQIVILHLTPDLYLKYLEPNKYHIGILVWETDKLSVGWAWYCNRMDEIWTRNESTKKVLIQSGVKVPIHVFPEPIIEYNPADYEPYVIANHRGFMFYTIFEWTQRKNPEALLTAYWEEFEGDDNVSLLLKTYRDNYTYQMHEKIKRWVEEIKGKLSVRKFPRVLYSHELLSQEDVLKLHATGDCFVSAHRGEGWGRPQMEAMVMGNPVISTNYGGIHEFLNENIYYPVSFELVQVTEEDDRPYYTKDQNWAEINKDDLKAKMRFVYTNWEKAKEVGLEARKFIQMNFNPMNVGLQMKKRLSKII